MHRRIIESKTHQAEVGTYLVQAVGCAGIPLPSPGLLLQIKAVKSPTT
jgi:hypothetical protein